MSAYEMLTNVYATWRDAGRATLGSGRALMRGGCGTAETHRVSNNNNIGWSYFNAEQYADALGMFEQALAWQQANGAEKEIRIARWCIARDLRALGRIEEALAMQQALFAEYQQSLAEDGYVSEELGECLLALGHPTEARPHFQRAYALLSQDIWLPNNEPDRLARLQSLATGDAAS